MRWLEVAPETHVFDITRIEPHVRALVEAEVHAPSIDRGRLFAGVERLIAAECGPWAARWTWAVSDGGPVRHYCCASHSLLPAGERRRTEPTIRRICDAVADWRRFLEELEAIFKAVHAEQSSSVEAMIERGATRVLAMVLQRTSAEDAWYHTCRVALEWLVEIVVDDVARARALVAEVVAARFASWTTPEPEVVSGAVSELATGIARGEVGARDALAEWLAIRDTAFGDLPVTACEPVTGDAHRRYIEEVDRPRDGERAERMLSALVLCRDSAAHGLALTFDQLAEWQALVMGVSVPVAFRTTEAFAKRGRERYAIDAWTHNLFASALVDAHDVRAPLGVRAARVYLDVCFFHPFPDGNARAARLALDHVLSSAGLRLRAAAPVFALPRAANDGPGAVSLAHAIARLAGPPRS